jgi:DNA-binding MarR family transcriptional regulator
MSISDVESIQRWYPQIYLACHTRHVRASSTVHRLSARDSGLLAHLSEEHPTTASDLAGHLGVSRSTLSGAIKKLQGLGYLKRTPDSGDHRVASLTLTEGGAKAMSATSVLDADRVAAVLGHLSAPQRKTALEGLAVLAEASRRFMTAPGNRKR